MGWKILLRQEAKGSRGSLRAGPLQSWLNNYDITLLFQSPFFKNVFSVAPPGMVDMSWVVLFMFANVTLAFPYLRESGLSLVDRDYLGRVVGSVRCYDQI